MHTCVSSNAYGRGRTPAAKTTPESLHAELRKAFREWLDSSKEWSSFQRTIEANEHSASARRQLAELEQRLAVAAKAFAEAKQRCSESPLYTAALHATISECR